jgi:hypothetical protein
VPEVVETTPEVVAVPPPPAESLKTQTPESAPAPEAEKPVEKPETDEQPEKRTSRFERRLNRAYRARAEAEARAKLLEERLSKLEAPKTESTEGAPRLEQFDDIEKYAAAREKYAAEKALKEFETRQKQEHQKQFQQKLVSAWEERLEKAAEKYDDFEDIVGTLQPTNPLTIAIMRAENGADIAYHLGKNPKEAMRIASLSDPLEQVLAVGQLGARLSLEPPKAKTPSKAPPPPVPLSGKTTPVSNEINPEDDMVTFIKKRNAQKNRNFGR